MHPYWFTFEPFDRLTVLNLGAGVTARDADDARRLLKNAFGDLPVVSMVILNSIDDLEPGHVRLNMGDILIRGIWFPLGHEQARSG